MNESARCQHPELREWDCGCVQGCGHCLLNKQCTSCGLPLRRENPAKPVVYEGVSFPSTTALARHIRLPGESKQKAKHRARLIRKGLSEPPAR